jgi:hypothetical protein
MREECRLRVFENRVLRRIFGPKRNEVTREWRRIHNDELYVLYSSPNIIRVGFWWGNLRERHYSKDQGVNGRIILKCFLEKWARETWTVRYG